MLGGFRLLQNAYIGCSTCGRKKAVIKQGLREYALAKKRRRKAPENVLQANVAVLLDKMGLVWCHVPNELLRGPVGKVMAYLKLGVKPGVCDVLIFSRAPGRPEIRGLAIELKVGRNKPTREQERWLLDLEQEGWATAVCYSIEEVRERLTDTGFQLPPKEG